MTAIETALKWAQDIANDDSHGYDQTNRWGADYDCSSLVISAWKHAGISLNCTYTGNMYSDMLNHGFIDVSNSVNFSTGSGLQAGDVLLNNVNHTALFIGGGKLVQASSNENGNVTGGVTGDQTGNEINIRWYYNFPWDCALRYNEKETETEKTKSNDCGNVYTVSAGDTLWSIAEKTLGKGWLYTKLMTANNLKTTNIYQGQKLTIPAKETEKTTNVSTTCSATLPVLQYGDSSVAVRCLQACLNQIGFDCPITGTFDSNTKNAVDMFHKIKGISENGVSAHTWEGLFK